MDDRTFSAGDLTEPARVRTSIRALMIALVLAVLIPAAAVLSWFLSIQWDQAREAAEAKVRLLVDSTMAALQQTLNDERAVMTRLAERPGVRALDADNFDTGVAEYIRLLPEFGTLTVRDRDARLIFTSRPESSPNPHPNPSPNPNSPEQFGALRWFKEGIAAGHFTVSDAFKGPVTGRWLTVLTHPVRDRGGDVVGLLSISQDLLTLNRRILGSAPSYAVVTVTDRMDRIVLRSVDPELWLGKPTPSKVMQETRGQREGFLSAKGPDGVTRLYAFATMADTGWRVVAGVPQDEAFAGHREMLRRSLVIGAGLMLLALVAAWFVARGIVGPIDALSRAATRVADGDGSARAPAAGPAEIRSVAHHFNRMVVAAQRDIDVRKQAEAAHRELEAQLRESQKMESIGTLAGGIAHDFNNILGAILGNLALARGDVGPEHPALQSLEQIDRASRRARGLVQQILAFSRRQTQVLVVQPLQPILEETLTLLRSGVPAMTELQANIVQQPLYVNADATQMQQVLMNLGTNAWHALQGNPGRIEIGLAERVLDAAAAQALGGQPAGRYAHLWVRDTGVGMDEATRARIFEPFFTTKADGTGLGMSVVHGIVKAHRGGISVVSEIGKGSTIALYFPLCEPPAADSPETAAAGTASGRGEHVLYVDDDEVVRLVVERLLQRAGWRARTVATADEALKTLDTTSFDLVVTDFNMPGASGLDLAKELARQHPRLPIVIISGYVSNELVHGAQRLGVHHVLHKQNLYEELAPMVQRVLSERGLASSPA
ncbi:MAG TPA: response regulator [Burkholderiaceae bacterium]|nr:response regulator [Burkholderiaceae bacterium]